MTGKNISGISISGHGSLNADVLAVGPGARAQKILHEAGKALDDRGLHEVREGLDALVRALNAHAAELNDGGTVSALAERVGTELRRDKPDKLSLRGLLSTIAEDAKPVVEIATAALSLGKLVAAFL